MFLVVDAVLEVYNEMNHGNGKRVVRFVMLGVGFMVGGVYLYYVSSFAKTVRKLDDRDIRLPYV